MVNIFISGLSAVVAQQTPSAEDLRKAQAVEKGDGSWKIGGNIGASFTQVALQNWSGGGKNTIAIIGQFNGSAVYKTENFNWNTTLDLGYGLTKLGEDPFRKSDDRIILISKAGYKSSEHLKYSFLLDFRTQFTEGRDFKSTPDGNGQYPRTSTFFAPAYLLTAAGMEWSPAPYFSTMVAPLTGRTTIVADDSLAQIGAYGMENGKKIRNDFGILLNMLFKKEIVENVTLQSRLNLFAPYSELQFWVVNWESMAMLKVNDFLNVLVGLDAFYDHRISIKREDGSVGPAMQLRNTFSLGIAYKFAN